MLAAITTTENQLARYIVAQHDIMSYVTTVLRAQQYVQPLHAFCWTFYLMNWVQVCKNCTRSLFCNTIVILLEINVVCFSIYYLKPTKNLTYCVILSLWALTVKCKTFNMCFSYVMFPNKNFTILLTEFSVNAVTFKK